MEEEYGDMQERYKMLEGERKSAYETSQFTIKQNRDTVATVKKENKDLRQALAQLQKEQAFKGAGDASAELDRLNGTVSELRKRYDDLRHTVYLKSKVGFLTEYLDSFFPPAIPTATGVPTNAIARAHTVKHAYSLPM